MIMKWLFKDKSKNTNKKNADFIQEKIDDTHELQEGWGILTFLSGTSFEGRQEIIKNITQETPIYLQREPDNPHDTNAIAVYEAIQHNKIGYIPREKIEILRNIKFTNKYLSKLMDAGEKIHAKVSMVVGDEKFRSSYCQNDIFFKEVLVSLSLDEKKAIENSMTFHELDNQVITHELGSLLMGFYKGNELKVTKINDGSINTWYIEEKICEFIYKNGAKNLNEIFKKIDMRPQGMEFPIYISSDEKNEGTPDYFNKMQEILINTRVNSQISTFPMADESLGLYNSYWVKRAYIINLNENTLEIYEGTQHSPNHTRFIYPSYSKEEFKGYYNAKLVGRYYFNMFPAEWFEGKPLIKPINYKSPFPKKEWMEILQNKMDEMEKGYQREWVESLGEYEYDEDGNPR